jgi:peptidoglycan/LPS O-acetylase OafA/YrhL
MLERSRTPQITLHHIGPRQVERRTKVLILFFSKRCRDRDFRERFHRELGAAAAPAAPTAPTANLSNAAADAINLPDERLRSSVLCPQFGSSAVMSHPHNPSSRVGTPHDPYIPALDGLRGLAAMLVAGAHYMTFENGAPLSELVWTLTGVGMTLFFVLSGFVIHYNYNATVIRPGGLRFFFVARFARLYPLYILLFLFDFAYTGLTARSACGHIGAPDEHWLGLPFYLTLTQSWLYAVICRASLAYQYGPVAAVSWSISVEMFFYLAYVVAAMLIARRKWSPRDGIVMAAVAFCLTVIYFLLCNHYQEDINRIGLALFGPAASTDNGYENSLMRWLIYFNPVARLSEFLAGLAAAHLYMAQRPTVFSASRASTVTLAALLTVVMIHLWLYGVVAYHSSLIGRTASTLYAPLVAMTVYLMARYDTPWSRLFSRGIPVRLGKVSYSMYLLHEIIPSAFKRLGLMTTDIAGAWVTWAGSLLLLALISLASYAVIERPARTWLRALLAPRRAPVLTAAQDS